MDNVLAFCKWLEQTPVGASVRQSLWLFPAIETVHLLGMAALLATIGAFSLRLMGVVQGEESISAVGRRLLPWTWAAFAIQVITGAMLFSSEATHMIRNPAFQIKMLLIALAGVQALVFHRTALRSRAAGIATQVVGVISLALWIGVVAAGRWIGFI